MVNYKYWSNYSDLSFTFKELYVLYKDVLNKDVFYLLFLGQLQHIKFNINLDILIYLCKIKCIMYHNGKLSPCISIVPRHC